MRWFDPDLFVWRVIHFQFFFLFASFDRFLQRLHFRLDTQINRIARERKTSTHITSSLCKLIYVFLLLCVTMEIVVLALSFLIIAFWREGYFVLWSMWWKSSIFYNPWCGPCIQKIRRNSHGISVISVNT